MGLFQPRKYSLEDDDEDQMPSQKLGRLYGTQMNAPPPIQSGMDPSQLPNASNIKIQQPQDQQDHQGFTDQEPHKEGFIDKIKHFFTGGNSTPEYDEYGIQKPHAGHEGFLNKLISIGLPAVYGLSQGVGLAPGLMTGLAANQESKARGLEFDTRRYDQERGQAMNQDYHDKTLGLQENLGNKKLDFQGRNLEERTKHHQTMGNVAQQNAGSNRMRAMKPGRAQTPNEIVSTLTQKLNDHPELMTLAEGQALRENKAILEKQGTIGRAGSKVDPTALANAIKGAYGTR